MSLSFMKNEADAEDVAQEAFLKAYSNLANFREQAKFSTWLISIALNEARGRLRRQRVLRMEPLDATPEEGGHVSPAMLRDWRGLQLEALERREVCEMLRVAIAELSPIYREVFLLRDVEELNTDETAKALEGTTATVKVRLHRARIMLQRVLAPQLKSIHPGRRLFSWS
jgi:RNA polymerase sigma-70 factor (ECF subfamily)